MKKILLKLLLALLPALFLVVVYVYNDPFKVLYHYDRYFPKDKMQYVFLNKDFVSTETFINNYDKYKYDAFIFGNSRSMFYRVSEWERHISSRACFHFDASDETLYGIEKKMEFLHKRGVHIKDALIIMDNVVLKKTENDADHIYIKDPNISGGSRVAFQLSFIKTFFDPDFLPSYLHLLYYKKPPEYSKDGKLFFNTTVASYDPATNELIFTALDDAIRNNPDSFYLARKDLFYKRDMIQQYSPAVIGEDQKALLLKMRKVLDEDQTNYRIIINPLYNQLKLNRTDMQQLCAIFGASNVCDFSGINDITADMHNYYENSHYRPVIATRIMDSIYAR